MDEISNEEIISEAQLKIHGNSDYDFYGRIQFIKGMVHACNVMLRQCGVDNDVITSQMVKHLKQEELDILKANLAETRQSIKSLYIGGKDKLKFKEWLSRRKKKDD